MRRRIHAALLLALPLAAGGCMDPVLWMTDRPTARTLGIPSDYAGTELADLMASPGHFLEKGVTVRCRYHGPARVYVAAYTDFSENSHRNFSAWPVGAPLWTPEGWAADVPCFYADRLDQDLGADLDALKPLELVEVKAQVASVFAGRPYLRVDAIRRLGGPALTLAGLGDIHAATQACAAGRWEDGAALAHKALGSALPEGAEPLLHRTLGRCLLGTGTFGESLGELERSGGRDPEMLGWQARAQLGLERPRPAIALLEEALAQAPRSQAQALEVLLARALALGDCLDDAYKALDRAEALDPKDLSAPLLRATLLLGEGKDLPRALSTAERVFAADPRRAEVQAVYGWALLASGKPAEAVSVLQQAAASGKPDPASSLRLAQALAKVGRIEEAQALLVPLAERRDDLGRMAREFRETLK